MLSYVARISMPVGFLLCRFASSSVNYWINRPRNRANPTDATSLMLTATRPHSYQAIIVNNERCMLSSILTSLSFALYDKKMFEWGLKVQKNIPTRGIEPRPPRT